MKVIHIIPAAFQYFDDIKSEAFGLIENLNSLGVDAEAFTLQYGTVTKSEEAAVGKATAPAYKLIETNSFDDVLGSLEDFDIIHLHCPFLGAAGKIIKWKKAHPAKPFVVSYYYDFKIVDFFSVFIQFYNQYYLPKLFDIADMIVCKEESSEYFAKKYAEYTEKAARIDDSGEFLGNSLPADLEVQKRLAFKYLMLYNGFNS